jgi:mRNA-degrading endonuclease toxin of MazEF toxin-antitoxin module
MIDNCILEAFWIFLFFYLESFNRKLRIHVTLDSYNEKKCNILFEQLKVISKTQILRKMEPINDKKIQAEINECIKYVLQV